MQVHSACAWNLESSLTMKECCLPARMTELSSCEVQVQDTGGGVSL